MLDLTNKFVSKTAAGKVQQIEHLSEPFLSPSLEEPTPRQLAEQYLAEVAPIYNIESSHLGKLSAAVPHSLAPDKTLLHYQGEKEIAGSIVVNYIQSFSGFPVWRSNLEVHIAPNPMRVTSSFNSLQEAIQLGNDPKDVADSYRERLTPEKLSELLDVRKSLKVTKINKIGLVVYRYQPDQRAEPAPEPEAEKAVSFERGAPTLSLPPVSREMKAGTDYVVAEVYFDLDIPEWKALHWQALVEPISGSVLYVRALVSGADGCIFRVDPISATGDTTLTPSAAEASLNALRTHVAVSDLVPADPQPLAGSQTSLQELEAPVAAGPTTSSPFQFCYNTKTSDFAAMNAYYHVNWIFNLMKGMGFNLSTYFDGTTFPVPVDHWSVGGDVNAHCMGNATGNGIGHFCFGVAEAGQTVGIADDIRVVIHEFGHALLWDTVSSPNFGFAHSAGDALGAILMDPISKAPDRYLSFPWPRSGGNPMDRRHDRKVADGWGWFGSRYNTQYNGEQVLSTTLFRLYQSVGGNSPHAADRAWASRYVAYLILKAIAGLTNTTNNPEVFATRLMNADLTTTRFEGHPGGALHKVIRWAFEKQGLYQPNAVPGTPTPVTTEGNPPAVDVYIDDGRRGEYQYQHTYWDTRDMWVRRRADGGTVHQNPVIGRTNYMYVRVRNRGTAAATNVAVRGFYCTPGGGMAWPDHWKPMRPLVFTRPISIPSGGQAIIGPLAWVPEATGCECLLAVASANGDPANVSTVTGPICPSRFIPFDNNIAQRNVYPVFILDVKKPFDSLKKLSFRACNPFTSTVKVVLFPVLPDILVKNKIGVFFSSPGGNKFTLGPLSTADVEFSLGPDPAFPKNHPWKSSIITLKQDIEAPDKILEREKYALPSKFPPGGTPKPFEIGFKIIAVIDGQNMGGVTYVVKYPAEK
jgi:hypothetical protein